MTSVKVQDRSATAAATAPDRPTLYLLDGHSLSFKAYYAIRGLTTPEGAPIGAAYGFLRMLLKLLAELSPEYLVVVFDTGEATFREDIFEAYKAHREAPPEDFAEQMGWIERLLKAMGIASRQASGYEADDVIATLASRMTDEGGRCSILTADKDLFQLVGDRVEVLRFGANNELERYDASGVEERLGVRPDQVADWLALVGDSSDNIPGVPSIGPKGAAELLRQFGSLEALLGRLSEVKKERQRLALAEHGDQARLSRRLATVVRDIDLDWDLERFRLPETLWNPESIGLLSRLGFESILKEYNLKERAAGTAAAAEPTTGRYWILFEAETIARWVDQAMRAPWVAVDTETTSLDALQAEMVGLSLAYRPGEAVYIPVGHEVGATAERQIPRARLVELLRPLLTGGGPELCAHNAKYDWKILRGFGLKPAAPAFDTMLASFVLEPGRAGGHGLKSLAAEILGTRMVPLSEIIGSGKNAVSVAQVPPEALGDYAARDADVTLRLRERFAEELRAEPRLERLFVDVEVRLIPVLDRMESGGFAVDAEALRRLGETMSRELERLKEAIWREAGRTFNIDSTKQLAQVLFEELKLPRGKKTKTGQSTDNTVLEQLAAHHPIAQLLLDYRLNTKLKSTYADALPRQVNARTGRIHTNFNQTIAQTGRLSSTDPNLQNIPVRTELGREIRRAFVPDGPDQALLSADYSQIELRILAHMSGDATLRRAYAEDRDVHALTAARLFGVEAGDVTSEMRALAKVVNFGIIYGMSAHGLAQRLRLGRAEAQRFIDGYFATYPGVRRWIDQTLSRARESGYVETLLGRRRRLPDLNAKNSQVRFNAERIAVNTPIQGTSADMIKRAMILIEAGLAEAAPGARMVLQVHDELIFSVPRQEIEAAGAFIATAMREALPLSVPIAVTVSSGPTWADCK